MHIDYAEPDEPRDTLLKNSKPVPLYCVVPLNNDNEMPLTIKLAITVMIPKTIALPMTLSMPKTLTI